MANPPLVKDSPEVLLNISEVSPAVNALGDEDGKVRAGGLLNGGRTAGSFLPWLSEKSKSVNSTVIPLLQGDCLNFDFEKRRATYIV